MRVITFSTRFPAKHPRKGEPTFFVEQILNSVLPKGQNGIVDINDVPKEILPFINEFFLLDGALKKHHTIRAGNRWKVGDKFSARIWTGDPYRSKQIEFAQIEIKKIWSFRISYSSYYVDEQEFLLDDLTILAKNDGLSVDDFETWFAIHSKKDKEDFVGQILCWNESIDYR